ncbi:MAG: metal-sulfur cluster assembly factor [Williamsia herbipolensis]|nr:metal-sulfur cluster assembly factor [Williamsia herbipolensis]
MTHSTETDQQPSAGATEVGQADVRVGRSAADLDADVAAPVDAAAAQSVPAGDPSVADVEDVLEALRDVVDPELGINIVDLGLVYDVIVDDANVATLDMTLTSAACPLTDMIEDQVRASLTGEGLVEDFRINWVWMPPWDLTRITDDGRDQLRALGFSI